MTEDAILRRLSAILAADVAGYSRLIAADEVRTLARFRRIRADVIDPTVARFQGRLVGTAGDSLLIEFTSALAAVECAVACQQELARVNSTDPEDQRIVFRMGVNLGDVIAADDTIHGDGVNVAARLEKLSEPGGLCMARNVYEQVKGKVAGDYADLGEQRFHNIPEPVRAYRFSPSDATEGGLTKVSAGIALSLPDKPSIAVLPFQNMSGDPEQEYFADGLTEDIITGLSRVRNLFVIARNSSFVYKGRAVSVGHVARELGVRYVLEGSLRKSERRIRITAQLIDAATGHHVWAEKFDRELFEIFDLQDEITQNVVASVQTQILLAEGGTSRPIRRQDLGVWGLVSRAMAAVHEATPESLAEGKALAERALGIDPNSGGAWRCLSFATYHQALMLQSENYEATLASALEAGERSVKLDSNDEYAHWNLGNVLLALRLHDRAIAEFERAMEINPNFSSACGSLGTALCYIGRPVEGIARNETAIRSDPLNPSIFFRYSGLALGHYLNGGYEQAAQWAEKSIRRKREWYLGHVYRIAAVSQSGRAGEAQSALHEYLRLFPSACISDLKRLPFRNESDFEKLSAGLRKAGLPE